MSVSDADIAFATDLFGNLGGLTKRKMFGGMCLYCDGIVFALLSSQGRIYIKTRNPVVLFGEATEQFHTMPYYALPEAALDDPEHACELARNALTELT